MYSKKSRPGIRSIMTTLTILLITQGVQSTNSIRNGIWRGTLKTGEKEAPFLFEVRNSPSDSAKVIISNGEERVALTGIKYAGDTAVIAIEAFDAAIRVRVYNDRLEGRFVKNFITEDKGIPFSATFNNKNRFAPVAQPSAIPVDGKWDILFIDDKGKTEHNVGIFKTQKGIVTGSVLTNSGDLRYLEGNYTEKGVQLSAFGGLSPYLAELSFKDNNSFEGIFYTARGKTRIEGTRNDKAGLADPYTLTKLKPGRETLSFTLPDINGNKVSIADAHYRNKVVIISILGSWCPNCLDEMKYLAPWYDANKQRGVEIIGLAFERKDDFEYAQGTLSRLKKRYNTGYNILFGGKAGPESVAKVLPELDNFSSYPTTIFIDKHGKVRKIHTGFNGPATGLFYEEFQKEFNVLVNTLLAE